MKLRLLVSVLSLSLAVLPALRAQEAKPDMLGALVANDALEGLMKKIQEKAAAGARTAEAYAPELKEFDENITLFAQDKEMAARFAFMKAMLFAEVISDLPRARELLLAVKKDYPGTESASQTDEILTAIEKSTKRDAANGDLQPLIEQVLAKSKSGSRDAAAFAPELAKFDALVEKYAANPEAAANVAFFKAMLYAQVLEQPAKGRELLSALVTKFPGTGAAENAQATIAQLEESEKRTATVAALVGKPAPELHFRWASKDGLKTLSSLKGQVVVLDFWATWCGPCIASFPQIREHVARFKGLPVAFVGVTSLQGRVSNLEPQPIDTRGDAQKELSLLPRFMKAKNMTWDVAVSEEEVFNPDYGIAGIPFLAIIAPDGTVRHVGLHPGDPKADVAGKIEALLKEFKLPTPKA